MSILLTNDDGLHAEHFKKFEEKLLPIAGVSVIAPKENRSGCGGSLSLNKRIGFTRFDYRWEVDGTAADAAYLGVHGVLAGNEDLRMVVSGINNGSNYGDDVFSSGTFGAAAQGRFLHCVPIAFSTEYSETDEHGKDVRAVAYEIVQWFYRAGNSVDYRERGFPIVLNVNIPRRPIAEIEGLRVTRMGVRQAPQGVWTSLDGSCFKIGDRGKWNHLEPADLTTDWKAVQCGYVSLTPCSLDMGVECGNVERLLLGSLSQRIEEMQT